MLEVRLTTHLALSVCREFDPSWKAVAHAWSKAPETERNQHFFATLDFDDAQLVFQKVSLNGNNRQQHLIEYRRLVCNPHLLSMCTLQTTVPVQVPRGTHSNTTSLSMCTLFVTIVQR